MQIGVRDGARLVVIEGDQAYDATDALVPIKAGLSGPLQAFLERGGTMAELADLDLFTLPATPLDQLTLQAPLPRPGKIVGAPVNYLDHKVEMSEQKTIADYGVFLKAGTSVIGPDEDVRLPYSDVRTDQEAELGVVIGRRASHVPAADALAYVFGYTCLLDITVRSGEDRSTRKSFDTFTPIGPWVVTADAVPDPGDLQLDCWVGTEHRQHTTTRDLIYSVPELIAYTSSVMVLEPGDVIATGTPAGVGSLSDGDRIVVRISGVGQLEVGVTARGAIPYGQRPGASQLVSR